MEDQTKIFIHGLKIWAKVKPRKSQTELAKVIGKSQSTISDYFKGEYYPEMDIIQLWIDHYKLDYEEILQAGRQELNPPTPETATRLTRLEALLPAVQIKAKAEAPEALIYKDNAKLTRENELLNKLNTMLESKVADLEAKIKGMEGAGGKAFAESRPGRAGNSA